MWSRSSGIGQMGQAKDIPLLESLARTPGGASLIFRICSLPSPDTGFTPIRSLRIRSKTVMIVFGHR